MEALHLGNILFWEIDILNQNKQKAVNIFETYSKWFQDVGDKVPPLGLPSSNSQINISKSISSELALKCFFYFSRFVSEIFAYLWKFVEVCVECGV